MCDNISLNLYKIILIGDIILDYKVSYWRCQFVYVKQKELLFIEATVYINVGKPFIVTERFIIDIQLNK